LAASLGILLALTACSKQNVGWIVLVGLCVILAIARIGRTHAAILLATAASTAGFIAWYSGVGLAYPLTSALSFIGERERLLMAVPPGTADLNGLLLLFFPWVAGPLALLLAALCLSWIRVRTALLVSPEGWGALVAGLAWLAGILSNWDSHWSEFPLAGMSMILLLSQAGRRRSNRRSRAIARVCLAMACAAFLTVAMGEGASRLRMRYVGPLFEDGPLTTVTTGFLYRLKLGPQGIAVVNAREAASTASCGEGSQVVLGPRLEFLYPQWSVPSPRGLPLWWHPGSSFSVEHDLPGILESLESMRPIQFVSLGDDFTRLPDQLVEQLTESPVVAVVGPLHVRCLT
jgi:hypothetical protein